MNLLTVIHICDFLTGLSMLCDKSAAWEHKQADF